MEVTFENRDNQVIAKISGEINTTTSPILEKELNDNVNMMDNLVLDFADVPNISSAGLRVLMKMEGNQKNFGSFSIRNVNDVVYEILKMVRFTDFIVVEGRETVANEMTTEASFDIDEFTLRETEIEMLPPRVRVVYGQGNLKSVAAFDDDNQLQGFAVYGLSKSMETGYLLFVYAKEEYREKGLESQLVGKVVDLIKEQGASESIYIAFANEEDKGLIARLKFENITESKTILNYTKAQIINSALWKQMDKLRTMFNRIQLLSEVDYVKQVELMAMLGDYNLEELDPLYSRIFLSEKEIKGFMNAQEVEENDIWVTKITVYPCKEANYGPILMLASLLEAVFVLLGDDDKIHIVLDKESQAAAYKKVLGEPMEVTADHYYRI